MACGGDAVLAAAYPTALNDALVWALTGVRRTWPLPGTATIPLNSAGSSPPALRAPPTADAAPLALAPRGSEAPDGFDRAVRTGYIADGPQLSGHVRAAVEAARSKRKRWASHRNLEPAYACVDAVGPP